MTVNSRVGNIRCKEEICKLGRRKQKMNQQIDTRNFQKTFKQNFGKMKEICNYSIKQTNKQTKPCPTRWGRLHG